MAENSGELVFQGEHKKGIIEGVKVSTILGRQNNQLLSSPAYLTTLPVIEHTFKTTELWHGTGRYQYDPKNRNQVRDVLQTILAEKRLIPHTDALDFTKGDMESISTSPARLYALMYAQCHFEKGKSLFDTKRNGLIWAYYLTPMAWRTMVETFIHQNPDYVKMLDRETRKAYKRTAQAFHDKYTKSKPEILEMTRGGQSDISGNYPILIGFKKGKDFQAVPIGRSLDKHELRTQNPIPLENFTHIEVPIDKVPEVQKILQLNGKNIPVYPLEWGIEYSKSLPLGIVLDGKPQSVGSKGLEPLTSTV